MLGGVGYTYQENEINHARTQVLRAVVVGALTGGRSFVLIRAISDG